MAKKLAVIGVGNMAGAIVSGIISSNPGIDTIYLFDKNKDQSLRFANSKFCIITDDMESAVSAADTVLLAVKPQVYSQVLDEIRSISGFSEKLYISIAAGITADTVSAELDGARVVRVLPNLPMTIGLGVSVICRNDKVSSSDFDFICAVFESAGSVMLIDESEMNRIIGVTSSSPAYVFKFIDAIYKGAQAQGLSTDGLIEAICDVFIGSAQLLKESGETPQTLISRVASKGGTTERAIARLESADIEDIIAHAMIDCTKRADELAHLND